LSDEEETPAEEEAAPEEEEAPKEIEALVYKSADFKTEKHVPVIEAPASAKKNTVITIKVSVGKQVPHPNTSVHHIRWIRVYFVPDGKAPIEIGCAEFTSHGESADGPDKGGVYTEPQAIVALKTDKPGKIVATSYCNIHGLWKSEVGLKVA